MLPFPAVVGEIDRLNELPELPGRFMSCADFGNNLRHRLPRLALRQILDEANHLAFLDAAFVPKTSPAAPLLSDTSCGVPCTHNRFLLMRSCGLVLAMIES